MHVALEESKIVFHISSCGAGVNVVNGDFVFWCMAKGQSGIFSDNFARII